MKKLFGAIVAGLGISLAGCAGGLCRLTPALAVFKLYL